MATLQLDEASKIYEFRNGLRDEVRDLLIGREIPADLNAFVHLCIAVDSAWLSRQQEKKLRLPKGSKDTQTQHRSKDYSSRQTHQDSSFSITFHVSVSSVIVFDCRIFSNGAGLNPNSERTLDSG
ncbi:hypothetical protein V1523DRAFT_419370 [Lipomyces doorenjongii]